MSDPPGDPPPGDPPPGPPPGDPPEPDDTSAVVKDLRRKVAAEQRQRAKVEQELEQMRTATQTESERAVAQARLEAAQEARVSALKEVGVKLAAAEFRAQAAGKLADPAAAIEVLDLGRFVDDDGEIDTDGIATAIDKLAAAAPGAGKPRAPAGIPNGVQPPAQDADWLRAAIGKS